MKKIRGLLKSFWADDRGLETLEYAIIASLVVAGTITAITAIGVWLGTEYSDLQTTLEA